MFLTIRLSRCTLHPSFKQYAPEPGALVRAQVEGQHRRRQVVLQHRLDGPFAQDAHAVELPAVEEHLRDAQVVAGGGVDAGAAGEEGGPDVLVDGLEAVGGVVWCWFVGEEKGE